MIVPEFLADVGQFHPGVDQNAVTVPGVDEALQVFVPIGRGVVEMPGCGMERANARFTPAFGEVIEIRPKEQRALVRGVNIVRRHQRQSASQEGGIISKEGPINLSNIAIEDPKDGKPTRIGFKILADGKKVRVAKRSGEQIPEKN